MLLETIAGLVGFRSPQCKNPVPIPVQHLGRSDSARPQGGDELVGSQDKIFWTGLLDHIVTLASERANEKKLNLLALVGLLEFSSVCAKEVLSERVRGVVRGFPFLLEAAEKQKGVMRFFAFRGLSMIGPPRLVNDRDRVHRLLEALKTYPQQTPALQFLRDNLAAT
jgi:hypothetical protein